MKRISSVAVMLLMLLVLILVFAGFSHAADKNYKEIKDTAHRIRIKDVAEDNSGYHCSATAVGPHALLTAGHCLRNSDVVVVDKDAARIIAVMNDGHDHAILLLSGVEFKKYADITQRALEVSESVFMVGNPDDMLLQFRKGYISGTFQPHDDGHSPRPIEEIPLRTMVDMNGFYGDSGAGIFDSENHVVSAVSSRKELTQENATPSIYLSVMEFKFTDSQLKMAKAFQ